MLTFYNQAVSNFGAKVKLVLAIKRIGHDERPPPGGYGSATYKAIVPAGTIPAIVHDGLVLSESTAIAEYLDEVWPEPPLLPATPADRARVRQLVAFHDQRLEPPLRALFPQMSPAGRDMALIAARRDEIVKRLAELEAMIEAAPFALGERPTLADTSFAATLVLGERMLRAVGLEWPQGPRVAAWRTALDSVPPIATTLAVYVEAVEAWLTQKGAAG